MLTLASDSIHHLQAMIDKINERIKDIDVKLTRCNIKPIVEQCVEELVRMVGRDVIIVRDYQSVPDVRIDPIHMKEVIHNILINAAESMAYRGGITVCLAESKNNVVLQIQDTGKGIPKDALSAIFQPFYSTKDRKRNYGLGLYYCKNVLRKHHGTLHVESVPGYGSTFSIHLRK